MGIMRLCLQHLHVSIAGYRCAFPLSCGYAHACLCISVCAGDLYRELPLPRQTDTTSPPGQCLLLLLLLLPVQLRGLSMAGYVLGPFLFAACLFGMIAQLATVVGEKEIGLVAALRQMGMSTAAHWGAWAAFDLASACATASSIVLWGAVVVLPLRCITPTALSRITVLQLASKSLLTTVLLLTRKRALLPYMLC